MLCIVATTVLIDLQLAAVGNTGDEIVIACNETFEPWCDDRTGIKNIVNSISRNLNPNFLDSLILCKSE